MIGGEVGSKKWYCVRVLPVSIVSVNVHIYLFLSLTDTVQPKCFYVLSKVATTLSVLVKCLLGAQSLGLFVRSLFALAL